MLSSSYSTNASPNYYLFHDTQKTSFIVVVFFHDMPMDKSSSALVFTFQHFGQAIHKVLWYHA